MERSIGSARADVQRAFERASKLADSAHPQRFCDFERELWTAVLVLGRALVSLFLAQQAARSRPVDYLHAGQHFVLKGERVSALATRFGKVSFLRPLGRPQNLSSLPARCSLALLASYWNTAQERLRYSSR